MIKKISIRLILIFTILLVSFSIILSLIFSLLFTKETEEIYKSEIRKRSYVVVETLEGYFESDIEYERRINNKGGMNGYGAFLRYINQIAGEKVWVIDANKNQLFNNHHESTEIALPSSVDSVINNVISINSEYIQSEKNFFTIDSLTLGTPILINNQIVAIVVVQKNVQFKTNNQANSYLILLISVLISLLFSLLLGIKLAKRFVEPIKIMEKYTYSLTKDIYTNDLSINTKDELYDLAKALSILSLRLEEAKNERENKEKNQQEFLSQIAHELRTPIMIIQSSLEPLFEGIIIDKNELQQYHTNLFTESLHLQRLVNDLLELSRLKSDGFSISKECFEVVPMIEDAIRSLRLQIKKKNQVINFENHIPNGTKIVGDYGRLIQLLKNLLDNAHKYGTSSTEIGINSKIKNTFIELTIKNKRVSKEKLDEDKVFNMFYKLNNDSSSMSVSTGMGLAISKQIVERHKGDIFFNNSADEVIIVVRLPLF